MFVNVLKATALADTNFYNQSPLQNQMPKAVLRNGEPEIAGLSLEDYILKLEKLQSDARTLGLCLETAVSCEPAAFVELYRRDATKKPVKVFVRCYEWQWPSRRGELLLLYDFAVGEAKLSLSTSIPHEVEQPPKQIKFVYGMPGPTEMRCKDPKLLRRYASGVRKGVKEALGALGFPRDARFEVSYDHPPLGSGLITFFTAKRREKA